MKQNLLAIGLVLALGTGTSFLISSLQDGKPAPTKTEAGPKVQVLDSLSSEQLDFPVAFVNIDSINAGYLRVADQNKALKSKENQAKSLAQQEQTLMGDAQKVENVARNGGFTQQEYEKQVMSLQKRGEYIARQQQKLQEDVMQMQMEMSDLVSSEIRDYLEANRERFGYRAVLLYGEGGNVLYADPELDITAELLSALNEEYQAQRPSPLQPK